MKEKIINIKSVCWCKRLLLLVFLSVMIWSNKIEAQGQRWIDVDGTIRPYWKIGKNAGEIKWLNDSTLYQIKYGADSAQFVFTKNPRGNHLWQDIEGRKWFKTKTRIDTIDSYSGELLILSDLLPLSRFKVPSWNAANYTLNDWLVAVDGSGGRRLIFGKSYTVGPSTTVFDTLAFLGDLDTDTLYVVPSDTARWSINILGGAANKIPYQVGADSTGFIDAPADSNKILYGNFKWKDLGYATLSGNNAFTGANTFSQLITPAASDGAALGSTTKMWSDLFLASGGVINFNNGDVTLTHSANTLTIAGGVLQTSGGLETGASLLDASGGNFKIPTASGGTAGTLYYNSGLKYYNGLTVESFAFAATTLAGYGITDGVATSRTLTINGTGYDLSANRSWTVGDVTLAGNNSLSGNNTTTGSVMLDGEVETTPGGDGNQSVSGKNSIIFYMTDAYTITLTSPTDGQFLWVSNDKDSPASLVLTPVRNGANTSLTLVAGNSVTLRYRSSESTWYSTGQ